MKQKFVLSLAAVTLMGAGLAMWELSCSPRDLNTQITSRPSLGGAPTTAPFKAAEDWPHWRGPRFDGISHEGGLAAGWPAGGPPRVWEADVGLGYSSPVAADGRVYLFTMNQKREALTCFDAATGTIVWNDEVKSGWAKDYPGTRATPSIDGDAIYTFGAAGDLICRDVANGKARWRVNAVEAAGAKTLYYGSASSPLVAMDRVFVQTGAGGSVAVAAGKQDGKILWKSELTGSAGYAATILADVEGTPQLIVFLSDRIAGIDPESGATLWTHPWSTNFGVNASTPIYYEGRLFVASAYGQGCVQLKLSAREATEVWRNTQIKSKFQQVILDNGYLYGNSDGRLNCVSWTDGTRRWQASGELELGDNGSLVRIAPDKLLLMGTRGKMTLARATPEGFTVISQAKAFEPERDEVWSTPLVYGGRLYAKGIKDFACFDLAGSR